MQKSYDDLAKKFSSIEDSLFANSNNSKMNKIVKYFDNKLTLSNKTSPPPLPQVCIKTKSYNNIKMMIIQFK